VPINIVLCFFFFSSVKTERTGAVSYGFIKTNETKTLVRFIAGKFGKIKNPQQEERRFDIDVNDKRPSLVDIVK
jgi:hypothetical protein